MFLASSNLDLVFDRNKEGDCISFSSLVGNRIFSSAHIELVQTEIGCRKLGRILMNRVFNEIMEYSGGLFVVKLKHKIEMLV